MIGTYIRFALVSSFSLARFYPPLLPLNNFVFILLYALDYARSVVQRPLAHESLDGMIIVEVVVLFSSICKSCNTAFTGYDIYVVNVRPHASTIIIKKIQCINGNSSGYTTTYAIIFGKYPKIHHIM